MMKGTLRGVGAPLPSRPTGSASLPHVADGVSSSNSFRGNTTANSLKFEYPRTGQIPSRDSTAEPREIDSTLFWEELSVGIALIPLVSGIMFFLVRSYLQRRSQERGSQGVNASSSLQGEANDSATRNRNDNRGPNRTAAIAIPVSNRTPLMNQAGTRTGNSYMDANAGTNYRDSDLWHVDEESDSNSVHTSQSSVDEDAEEDLFYTPLSGDYDESGDFTPLSLQTSGSDYHCVGAGTKERADKESVTVSGNETTPRNDLSGPQPGINEFNAATNFHASIPSNSSPAARSSSVKPGSSSVKPGEDPSLARRCATSLQCGYFPRALAGYEDALRHLNGERFRAVLTAFLGGKVAELPASSANSGPRASSSRSDLQNGWASVCVRLENWRLQEEIDDNLNANDAVNEDIKLKSDNGESRSDAEFPDGPRPQLAAGSCQWRIGVIRGAGLAGQPQQAGLNNIKTTSPTKSTPSHKFASPAHESTSPTHKSQSSSPSHRDTSKNTRHLASRFASRLGFPGPSDLISIVYSFLTLSPLETWHLPNVGNALGTFWSIKNMTAETVEAENQNPGKPTVKTENSNDPNTSTNPNSNSGNYHFRELRIPWDWVELKKHYPRLVYLFWFISLNLKLGEIDVYQLSPKQGARVRWWWPVFNQNAANAPGLNPAEYINRNAPGLNPFEYNRNATVSKYIPLRRIFFPQAQVESCGTSSPGEEAAASEFDSTKHEPEKEPQAELRRGPQTESHTELQERQETQIPEPLPGSLKLSWMGLATITLQFSVDAEWLQNPEEKTESIAVKVHSMKSKKGGVFGPIIKRTLSLQHFSIDWKLVGAWSDYHAGADAGGDSHTDEAGEISPEDKDDNVPIVFVDIDIALSISSLVDSTAKLILRSSSLVDAWVVGLNSLLGLYARVVSAIRTDVERGVDIP